MMITWEWFGHNFGIGVSLDWTLLWHVLIYGATVPVAAFANAMISYRWWGVFLTPSALVSGLVASMTAALYLESLQAWQYEWSCGMGDPIDLLVSWVSAYVVYKILRRL